LHINKGKLKSLVGCLIEKIIPDPLKEKLKKEAEENQKINIVVELRKKGKYNKWRRAVLRRDKWRCVECGSSRELHVHHIFSYKDYEDLRLVVSNGLTLCKEHHWGKHKRRAI